MLAAVVAAWFLWPRPTAGGDAGQSAVAAVPAMVLAKGRAGAP
jgi:hypothetical protein